MVPVEMSYQGAERRRHQTYVTRNTEYHLRDGVCVAVRDRRTGRFVPAHIAVTLPLLGAVKIHSSGTAIPRLDRPTVGDALCFSRTDDASRQIVTSRVESIERPQKAVVESYGCE
jgi:hypothetical protein